MSSSTGLDGRHRDRDGRISSKHSNTVVESLRQTYGSSFAPGIRADAHLGTLLNRTGSVSLSDYLRNHNK